MKRLTTLLFLMGVVFIANGFAQSDNQLARFTILIPKDGMQRQFEDGYKRHLKWHVDNGETWNWYGWFVASGTRLGYFIDATFEHSWSDFDKPINPAADRADLEVNVFPFVTLFTQFTCVHLTSYSARTNTDLSAASTQVTYFKVKPGKEREFEKFLAAFRDDYPKIAPDQNFSWYRVEDGDKTPQYLLFVPHKNQAERQKSDNFWTKLWQQNAEAQTRFQDSVAEITTETMRYRADLTFVPSKSATK
jgi:hypothetical protein